LIKLKITCREATQITLQGEDRAMPLAERLSLRLHHRVCSNCRRFFRQVQLMRQASARWRQYASED
jgi:predicted anti-sigma-YlaC factor YlaD